MSMVKVKTADLIGAQLDWAVEKADGYVFCDSLDGYFPLRYSRAWAAGGPIIERERIELICAGCNPPGWMARRGSVGPFSWSGPTPLVAAMRALVASKLGGEVEVPEVQE